MWFIFIAVVIFRLRNWSKDPDLFQSCLSLVSASSFDRMCENVAIKASLRVFLSLLPPAARLLQVTLGGVPLWTDVSPPWTCLSVQRTRGSCSLWSSLQSEQLGAPRPAPTAPLSSDINRCTSFCLSVCLSALTHEPCLVPTSRTFQD